MLTWQNVISGSSASLAGQFKSQPFLHTAENDWPYFTWWKIMSHFPLSNSLDRLIQVICERTWSASMQLKYGWLDWLTLRLTGLKKNEDRVDPDYGIAWKTGQFERGRTKRKNKRKAPAFAGAEICKKKWGGWRDSNARITEPQSAVLTASPQPPFIERLYIIHEAGDWVKKKLKIFQILLLQSHNVPWLFASCFRQCSNYSLMTSVLRFVC